MNLLRMIRRRWKIVLPLLFVAMVPVLGSCAADWIVLGENRQSVDAGKARREVIKVDGRDVEYWVARSPGAAAKEPEALVLYFIGKGGRADRWIGAVADTWRDRPIEAWGMNYPGSGGSEGPVDLARIGPSALAVYDAAKRAAGDRPIFIQGGSFGTTVSLCVAARRPVAGLVLQNPPPLKELIRGHYGWWNLWLLAGPVSAKIPDDLDSVGNAPKVAAPAVFILHGADETIPPAYQKQVTDAYAGKKRTIEMPGAKHSAPLTREATQDLQKGIDWLWKSPRARATQPTSRPATSLPTTLPQ